MVGVDDGLGGRKSMMREDLIKKAAREKALGHAHQRYDVLGQARGKGRVMSESTGIFKVT